MEQTVGLDVEVIRQVVYVDACSDEPCQVAFEFLAVGAKGLRRPVERLQLLVMQLARKVTKQCLASISFGSERSLIGTGRSRVVCLRHQRPN